MIKRFIISNSELADATNYSIIKLSDGVNLFYSPDLNITVIDENCIVIGNMVSVVNESFGKLYRTVKRGEKDIEDILYYMCGRYVVIYDAKLYLDAFGLLGVFYCCEDDKYFISNDLNTYTQYLNKKVNDYAFDWHKDFLNYMPAPLTTMDGVFKMLNTQYVEFNRGGYTFL